MAGKLPVQLENFKQIPWAKIAIISSFWHQECVDVMVHTTKTLLINNLQVREENISLHKLPGSFELPYAAGKLFTEQDDLDAIIAFGVVLQGDTTHDASVIQGVVNGFLNVSSQFNKPIINEVIGVTDIKHAHERKDFKGYEAAFAVSELLSWSKNL